MIIVLYNGFELIENKKKLLNITQTPSTLSAPEDHQIYGTQFTVIYIVYRQQVKLGLDHIVHPHTDVFISDLIHPSHTQREHQHHFLCLLQLASCLLFNAALSNPYNNTSLITVLSILFQNTADTFLQLFQPTCTSFLQLFSTISIALNCQT